MQTLLVVSNKPYVVWGYGGARCGVYVVVRYQVVILSLKVLLKGKVTISERLEQQYKTRHD